MPRASAGSVSVVIPIFNEEESLRLLHREISETLQQLPLDWYEIIFIDDGSVDGSYEVACELHEKDPEHMVLIRLRRNFGQTAAMAAGFDAARGKVVVTLDADLQFIANVRADRYQVVFSLQLHPVPGIIKKADAVGPAQFAAELDHCPFHGSLVGIENASDFKPHVFQRVGHQRGIIPRIAQW